MATNGATQKPSHELATRTTTLDVADEKMPGDVEMALGTEPIPSDENDLLDNMTKYGSKAVAALSVEQLFEQLSKTYLSTQPQVIVRFKNVNLWEEVPEPDYGPTTLLKVVVDGFTKKPVRRNDILKDLHGEFRPGKMTLVLGPPASGKSVFMKVISGRFHLNKGQHLDGEITYNGDPLGSNRFVLPKVVTYIDQDDIHEAVLTVRETLQFAWENSTGGTHAYGADPQYQDRLKALDGTYAKVRMFLYLYGLKHAADTVVGDEFIRGVSGGEKKRTTSAEMLMTNSQVFFMDAISTGLDSAATADIVRMQKEASARLGLTTVMALQQPAPEVFDMFDDVMLLVEGRIIYLGPKDTVMNHFSSLGFCRPPTTDIADFLQEVALPEGRSYIAEGVAVTDVPNTVFDFQSKYEESGYYKAMLEDLNEPSHAPGSFHWQPSQTQRFAGTWTQHLWYNMKRQGLVVVRDTAFWGSRVGQAVFGGIIVGTVFFNLRKTDINNKFGMIFFAAIFLAFASMPALVLAFQQRPVYYKHRDASFYPTSAFCVAQLLVQSPLHIIETVVFSSIAYWMVGLSPSNGGLEFACFMLICFWFGINFGQLFRLLSACGSTLFLAQPLSGLVFMLFVLFSGFLQSKDNIPKGWIWMYYINPFQWVLSGLLINEFLSDEYKSLPEVEYNGKNYSAGVAYLKSFGYEPQPANIWIGIAVVIVEFFIFLWLQVYLQERIRFTVIKGAAVTHDDEKTVNLEDIDRHSLPFEPVVLAFRDLWYTVEVIKKEEGGGNKTFERGKKESIDLLKGVDGFCRPGSLLALMGSSGAGKTTLLDVLAGRKTKGVIKGCISVNGKPIDYASFSKIMGYVEQMDVHQDNATVHEALLFSARLRLPESVSKEARETFVTTILALLELDTIADRVIGNNEVGGLSFEQRKRLTIGVELVANPSILFLDEPTSGLDARAAAIVMRVVKRVALTGRSVICTIHQPSAALFYMFDGLLLLKRGGQTVFFGDLGLQAANLIQYFENIPGTARLPARTNPASWMLELIGAGTTSAQESEADFVKEYKSSNICAQNAEELAKLVPADMEPVRMTTLRSSGYRVSYWTQFIVLFRRVADSYWRAPTYNLVRMLVMIVLALLFGSVYSNGKYNTEASLRGRLAVLFMTTLFGGLLTMFTVIAVAAADRGPFYREQASNMYSVGLYTLTSCLIEIPYTIVQSGLFVSIFYFIVKLNTEPSKFLWYWLFWFVFLIACVFMGKFFGVVFPNVQTAQLIAGSLASIMNLFSGFIITPNSIPPFWTFAYWIAPTHYVLEGQVITQYYHDDTSVQVLGGGTKTAEQFVNDYFGGSFKESHVIYDLWVLIGMGIGFGFCSYLALKYLRYTTR